MGRRWEGFAAVARTMGDPRLLECVWRGTGREGERNGELVGHVGLLVAPGGVLEEGPVCGLPGYCGVILLGTAMLDGRMAAPEICAPTERYFRGLL